MSYGLKQVRFGFSAILLDPRRTASRLSPWSPLVEAKYYVSSENQNSIAPPESKIDPVSHLQGNVKNKLFDVETQIDHLVSQGWDIEKSRSYMSMVTSVPILDEYPKYDVYISVDRGGELSLAPMVPSTVIVQGRYAVNGVSLSSAELLALLRRKISIDSASVIDNWVANERPAVSDSFTFLVANKGRLKIPAVAHKHTEVRLPSGLGSMGDSSSPIIALIRALDSWGQMVKASRFPPWEKDPHVLGGSRGNLTIPQKLEVLNRLGTQARYYVDGSTPDDVGSLAPGESAHALFGRGNDVYEDFDFTSDPRLLRIVHGSGQAFAILATDEALLQKFRQSLRHTMYLKLFDGMQPLSTFVAKELKRSNRMSSIGTLMPGPFIHVPVTPSIRSTDGRVVYGTRSEVPPTPPLLGFSYMSADYVAVIRDLGTGVSKHQGPRLFHTPGSDSNVMITASAENGFRYINSYLYVNGMYTRALENDMGARYVSAPTSIHYNRGVGSVYVTAYSMFGSSIRARFRRRGLEVDVGGKMALSGHMYAMCIMPPEFFLWCLYELILNYVSSRSIYVAPLAEHKQGRYHEIGEYLLGLDYVEDLCTGVPDCAHTIERAAALRRLLSVLARHDCVRL